MSDVLDAETEPSEDGPNMKQLRELAKKGEKAEEALAQAAGLQREIAVLKSGIDSDSPLGKMFLKGYDGDPTDTDAMKSAAADLGIPFKEGSAPAPVETVEPNGTEERQQLAAEAPADTGVEINPIETATKTFFEDTQTGATWENGAGKYIATLAGAALAGDPRVIVTERPR